ncbi:1-Acylglycerol-3-phosphate O-acyltransferase 4 [Carabus blaptoides fortunei]
MLLSLSDKANCSGNSKTFIKNVVQYTPGFGMVLYFADYVCLHRSFEKDKIIIENTIASIMEYPDPIWLVLYPEGTRFTKAKHEIAIKYAEQNGLPQLKHHLNPRTKGFLTSLSPMRNKMDALYDITIAFNPNDENKPTVKNILLGRKVRANFYIKRIPFAEIPQDKSGIDKFIRDMYIKKDKLRETFYQTGSFELDDETTMERIKLKRNYSILITAFAWHMFSISLSLYYIFLLLIYGSISSIVICLGILATLLFLLHKALGLSKIKNSSSYGQ